jgi:hypothetical protein
MKDQACGWRAYKCQGAAKHRVRLKANGNFVERTVPMCDWCASIFDPALGARSGYAHDFLSREPLT